MLTRELAAAVGTLRMQRHPAEGIAIRIDTTKQSKHDASDHLDDEVSGLDTVLMHHDARRG